MRSHHRLNTTRSYGFSIRGVLLILENFFLESKEIRSSFLFHSKFALQFFVPLKIKRIFNKENSIEMARLLRRGSKEADNGERERERGVRNYREKNKSKITVE